MIARTGIAPAQAPPLATRLLGAIPNPFNAATAVHFEMAGREQVRLRIFDSRGGVVSTLLEGEIGPGRHAVPWDGRATAGQDVASGVYFLRLEAGAVQTTKKVVVLR